MPLYSFRNKKTNSVSSEILSVSELDPYLEQHPELIQEITAPAIVSGVDGLRRPDDGFRDLLKEMKKVHKKGDFGKGL